MVKEQVREMNKEIAEKTEKYKKCKQMLAVSKWLILESWTELQVLNLKTTEATQMACLAACLCDTPCLR